MILKYNNNLLRYNGQILKYNDTLLNGWIDTEKGSGTYITLANFGYASFNSKLLMCCGMSHNYGDESIINL